MTREERLALACKRLDRALEKLRTIELDSDLDERKAVIRLALYRTAVRELDGHVREIVWTHPPFPEEEDHE